MKSLVILVQRTDLAADLIESAESDSILALSPSAIDQCEELGIPCLTPDDLVSYRGYQDDAWRMSQWVISAGNDLDARFEKAFGGISAYRSDRYRVWMFLGNLLYIERLARAILSENDKVTLLGAPRFRELVPLSESNTRSDGLSVLSTGGIEFATAVLVRAIPQARVKFEPEMEAGTQWVDWVNIARKIRPLLGKMKHRLLERGKCQEGCRAKVLISGIGYGWQVVEKEMAEVEFVEIDTALPPASPQSEPLPFSPEVNEIWSASLQEWFSLLKDDVLELLQWHYRHLGRLADLERRVKKMFNTVEPAFIILTHGAYGQELHSVAREANRRKVPLVDPQHSGTRLHRHPDGIEVENSENVASINIFQGRLDAGFFQDGESFRGGNILAWQAIQGEKVYPDRILYLHGGIPSICYAYTPFSDKQSFMSHAGFLRAIQAHGVDADIKVHILLAEYNKRYFHAMARRLAPDVAVRIIWDSTAEKIMHRYGAIVVEHPASLATNIALAFDVPVILHLSDRWLVRDEVGSALEDRVYFSKNEDELKELIRRWSEGGLTPKDVDRGRENFMWPVEDPYPIRRTVGFLRKLLVDGCA